MSTESAKDKNQNSNPVDGSLQATANSTEIPDKVYFRIGDVAEILNVKPYVLRYWETEFPVLSPEKSTSGQRVYKRSDVETLLTIKHLLYQERYSIEGARKRIKELKKDGELQNFKRQATPTLAVESLDVARELLARPISALFRF